MLRPLDEALIDMEKTYREIFKQPLYEHEQYTKRQLIYNYAEVGSEFINQLITSKKQTSNDHQVDLSQVIKQWNDKSITVQQMLQKNQKVSLTTQEPLQQQEKAFLKQIQVVKKDKIITKSKAQRNVNYRKELEILFKSRNNNMINVQSLRNHFSELKPYNNFHSKNKTKKFQQNSYQQNKYQNKYDNKYQDRNQQKWPQKDNYTQRVKFQQPRKQNEDLQNYQQNYGKTIIKKESFNYRAPNEKFGRQNQQRQFAVKRQETTRYESVYQKDANISPQYNSQYQYRPQSYFPPPEPYSSVSQFATSPQYGRPAQDQSYKKYSQQQLNSSHNQFYQQNFPKPYQREQNPSSNNTYSTYENNYRGSYGSRTDLKGQYRPQG